MMAINICQQLKFGCMHLGFSNTRTYLILIDHRLCASRRGNKKERYFKLDRV